MECKKIEFCKIGKAKVSLQKENPKGIIIFFGGYFFGSFPIIFYRKVLTQIKESGYTVVVFSYSLLSDHVKIAEILFQDYVDTLGELEKIDDFYKYHKNYSWVAHSLGCEYIALLILLSISKKDSKNINDINDALEKICNIFKEINEDATRRIFELSLSLRGENKLSQIGEQTSVFIAPCFKPPTSLLQFLIKPTQQQIWNCIEEKKDTLFNLTSVISFTKDCIAGNGSQCQECTFDLATKNSQKLSDVCFLVERLKLQDRNLWLELEGNHMTPICLNKKINLAESVVNLLNKQKSLAN